MLQMHWTASSVVPVRMKSSGSPNRRFSSGTGRIFL
jgi:hypothetical protein